MALENKKNKEIKMRKIRLTQIAVVVALVLGLMGKAQAAQYICYNGKDLGASKSIFKIKEIPESKTFTFEYFQDQRLVLTNKSNTTGSELKLSTDGSNAKVFTHNSANMTVKIYPTQIVRYGVVKGEFNFYQPKVNGDQFTSLNCSLQ